MPIWTATDPDSLSHKYKNWYFQTETLPFGLIPPRRQSRRDALVVPTRKGEPLGSSFQSDWCAQGWAPLYGSRHEGGSHPVRCGGEKVGTQAALPKSALRVRFPPPPPLRIAASSYPLLTCSRPFRAEVPSLLGRFLLHRLAHAVPPQAEPARPAGVGVGVGTLCPAWFSPDRSKEAQICRPSKCDGLTRP